MQQFVLMMDNINTSVISNKIHYSVKLGRFIVSYNQITGTLDCGCCSRKQICVHKAMSTWFFEQNEMLNDVNFLKIINFYHFVQLTGIMALQTSVLHHKSKKN